MPTDSESHFSFTPKVLTFRRIAFNVGGRLFETTEQTVRRIPDTRLTHLLDDDPMSTEFFIDHDPRYFEIILNFLRNRSFSPDYADEFINDLEKEAQFYGISELANLCRTLKEPLKTNDQVQWRRDAIDDYWKIYVKCVVDNTLYMPFTYERNSHFLSKCIACDESYDPKCANIYDINIDDWSALAHHMKTMKGKVVQERNKANSPTCCVVKWENGSQVHLPRTALRRVTIDRVDTTNHNPAARSVSQQN